MESDASKSSPWLTFIGWVSNTGNAHAPIACRGLQHLSEQQGSLLLSALGETPRDDSKTERDNAKVVLRVLPFYHR